MKIQDVKIDKEIVLKFLGYKNRKVPKYIEKVIDEEINRINEVLDIHIHINKVNRSNHNFKGEYINNCFQDSEESYAVLYTIGNKIEEKIDYCINNNDMTRGVILDKVGIVALDYVGHEIKKYLQSQLNLSVIYEIYPGDKDFKLENQQSIYKYVENSHITINEYNQMTPIKSVALIICLSSKCKKLDSRCDKCLNKCF